MLPMTDEESDADGDANAYGHKTTEQHNFKGVCKSIRGQGQRRRHRHTHTTTKHRNNKTPQKHTQTSSQMHIRSNTTIALHINMSTKSS